MAKITLKLQELAQKLGKSITDIAEETGLNRNTVTALYHNKVDGIKFETLIKLCDVYNLSIIDLLELKTEITKEIKPIEYYKQEGEVIPFTGWFFGLEAGCLNSTYFNGSYGEANAYFKGNYTEAFWPIKNINELAIEVYEKYSKPSELKVFFAAYAKTAIELENQYFANDEKAFLRLSKGEFKKAFSRLQMAYADFWQMSMFIDAFDAGFDQQKIKEIAEQYHFTLEEISLLSTPAEMTFNNERLLALYELVIQFKRQKKTISVVEFVKTNTDAIAYRKKFDYYKSNYSFVKHITVEEQAEEIAHWLKNDSEFKTVYSELKNYTSSRQIKTKKLLKKHKLSESPLYFFQILTYWREHRKKANLMGIHLAFSVLAYLEEQSGIKLEYLKYINPDEVDAVLSGSITQEILEKRYNEGLFVTFNKEGYKMVLGKEAESLKSQYEGVIETGHDKVLYGQVASQGYARGVARIILNQSDFDKFKEGEILVTSMTRPEYLPIMKIAAAFVTNEGGITCHAAIVARELNKPCVIGTKSATQVIKDGDLIEVRANHGTVRILS